MVTRIETLGFKREYFALFANLFDGISWARVLGRKKVCDCW